jgi:lactam utilization protein B
VVVAAKKSLMARVTALRDLVESFGPKILYRKLHGILNALEMKVEDGKHQRHAVVRLCEALLANAELHPLPETLVRRLEDATCAVATLVEDGR